MPEKKILVVDDEDYQRDLMGKFLSKLGYPATIVESPEDALSLLNTETYPLIITDLIMLEMDGVEFCRRIRETNSKLVIIGLSGHKRLYAPDKLKEVGFDDVLAKPINIESLKEAIEKGLEMFEARVIKKSE